MKTIMLKRSALALMKSIGKTNVEIADQFGIKESEVKTYLIKAGLIKSRKTVKEPEYVINYIDDSNEILGNTQKPAVVEPIEA